ncbi:hypothetical protein ACXET9_07250 [Brachybacterium sp. DNPG3]
MNALPKPFPHGIDITAPGGIDALLAFHRRTFGDARMSIAPGAGEPPGDDGAPGDEDAGNGGQPAGGDGDDPDKGMRSALAAERAAAKQARTDLAAAQARVKELEDASKSEEQKRQEAAERLQSEHAQLTRDLEAKDALLERYAVAAAKGLDLSAAERLRGTTREEIEKDADDWIAKWGTGAGSSTPPPDPGQGPRPDQKQSSYEQGSARAQARYGAPQKQQ